MSVRGDLHGRELCHSVIVHLTRHVQVKIEQNIKLSRLNLFSVRIQHRLTHLMCLQVNVRLGMQRQQLVLLCDWVSREVNKINFKALVLLQAADDVSEVPPDARVGREERRDDPQFNLAAFETFQTRFAFPAR